MILMKQLTAAFNKLRENAGNDGKTAEDVAFTESVILIAESIATDIKIIANALEEHNKNER